MHKTRCLRRAVMKLEWAQQSISQVVVSKYMFVQFVTALQESIQIIEEISRARAPDIHYRQYMNDPRTIRHSKNHAPNEAITGAAIDIVYNMDLIIALILITTAIIFRIPGALFLIVMISRMSIVEIEGETQI